MTIPNVIVVKFQQFFFFFNEQGRAERALYGF